MASQQTMEERARALHVELGIGRIVAVITKLREEFDLNLLDARELAEVNLPLSFRVRARVLTAWDSLTRAVRYHKDADLPVDHHLEQARLYMNVAMAHLRQWAIKHADFELPEDDRSRCATCGTPFKNAEDHE